MWAGEGWKRTRRQLGFFGFIICGGLDISLHLGVPLPVYGIVGGLLGLDVINAGIDAAKKQG